MNTPVMLALLALVSFGLTTFLLKVAGAHQAYGPSYMLADSAGFVTVAVVMHLVQRHPVDLSPKIAGLAALGGVVGGIGTLAVIFAFRLGGHGSIIFPISGLGLVVAVILAFVVYREPVTTTKLLGLGLGVSSIIVLSR